MGQVTLNIVIDNTKEAKKAIEDATEEALASAGIVAGMHIDPLVPIDTGNLRGSITMKVLSEEKEVHIGTNVHYAPYVEFGTSKMAPQSYLRSGLQFAMGDIKTVMERVFREALEKVAKK